MGTSSLGVRKIFDSLVIGAGGTATSAPIEMGRATALALHLKAIAGVAPDVGFTYSLGNTQDDTFIIPSAPATIDSSVSAPDVLDFAPELAQFIKIIATNNNGAAAVTITAVLVIQEI